MLIFSEEVVEYSQGRLEIQVNDVFRSCFGFWQSGVLHQLKSQSDIDDFLVKRLEKTLQTYLGSNFY